MWSVEYEGQSQNEASLLRTFLALWACLGKKFRSFSTFAEQIVLASFNVAR